VVIVLVVILRGWSPEDIMAALSALALVLMVLRRREQLA
jgi:hypothetical protein